MGESRTLQNRRGLQDRRSDGCRHVVLGERCVRLDAREPLFNSWSIVLAACPCRRFDDSNGYDWARS